MVFVLLGLWQAPYIYADAVDYLNSTITISICGNSIIEGGEDCEGVDLNGNTCLSLGYAGGTLSCDSACEYILTSCLPKTSPSPSAAATTTETSTETTTTGLTAAIQTVVSQVIQTIAVPFRREIPAVLAKFDNDASGRLELKEMRVVVSQWVEGWRKIMALNLANLPRETTEKLLEPNKETGMEKLLSLLSPERKAESGESAGAPETKIGVEEAAELQIFSGAVAIEREDLDLCDINNDERCNLIDLSILLYFIGR